MRLISQDKLIDYCDKRMTGSVPIEVIKAEAPIFAEPAKWISTKERMPDTSEQGMDVKYSDCCLVCDDFGWIGMGYYMTDGKKSWWEFADAQNKIKIDWTEITHWMPLPEPPKDGDANG